MKMMIVIMIMMIVIMMINEGGCTARAAQGDSPSTRVRCKEICK